MPIVLITADAQSQFDDLPLLMKGRVAEVFVRLERWPAVSGHKALTGSLKGSWRIRSGDYRVVFRVVTDAATKATTITVWKIGNRRDLYLD